MLLLQHGRLGSVMLHSSRVAARHVASGGRPVEHAHGRRMLLLSP